MSDRRRAALLTAMAALSWGCGQAADDEVSEAARRTTLPAAAATGFPPRQPRAGTRPLLPDTALAATVSRTEHGRYRLSGGTRAAPALEVSLEDGQRVLFGPTRMEVQEGAFQLEFAAEPTERPVAILYLTTPDGARQWAIPVPRDSARASIGPGLWSPDLFP